MPAKDTSLVIPEATCLRPIPADLLSDPTLHLRLLDARHQRLVVGALALGERRFLDDSRAAFHRIRGLYEACAPGLLNRPTKLSAAGVIAELEMLLDLEAQMFPGSLEALAAGGAHE